MRSAIALAALAVLIGSACTGGAPATPSPSATPGTSAGATAAASVAPVTPSLGALVTPTAEPSPTGPSIEGVFEDASEAPAGAVTIVMTYTDSPAYVPSSATISASNAVFFLHNKRDVFSEQHNFNLGPAVGDRLVRSPAINADRSGVFTVTGLQAGTYKFWCTIHDHHLDGMIGTLTVTP